MFVNQPKLAHFPRVHTACNALDLERGGLLTQRVVLPLDLLHQRLGTRRQLRVFLLRQESLALSRLLECSFALESVLLGLVLGGLARIVGGTAMGLMGGLVGVIGGLEG